MLKLVGTTPTEDITRTSINILGEFNIAGETWILRDYYGRMGVDVVSNVTGDGRVEQAVRTLGAGPGRVYCTVTVPLA